MSITNTARPGAPGLVNITRVSFGETWASITTTWASETRTWAALISLITNSSKPTSSMTNTVRP